MNEENKPDGREAVNDPSLTADQAPSDAPVTKVVTEDDDDEAKYMTPEEYERAKLNQNLPLGLIAGVVAGIVCAGLWAAFTVATSTIYSFMAILVGLGVGFVVRKAGRGVEMKFGIVGAVIALLSCALGNFLATIGFIASEMETGFFDILFNFDYSLMPMIMKETFDLIDVAFYALAVVSGFTTSYHKVKIQ